MNTRTDLHSAWARLFLSSLARSGVETLYLSPGSRSTPLALAASASGLATHVVVDERTAAFCALGEARVAGKPVALLATSGTAPAHWLPAVVEASLQHLPLILLSADRPWEDQGVGTAQTIDQTRLFGAFVREDFAVGVPDPAREALLAVPRIAGQAVAAAKGPAPGPVHVNLMFRKPLEPVAVEAPEPWTPLVHALDEAPPPLVRRAATKRDEAALDALADACARARRGLLVCGPAQLPNDPSEASGAISALADATGFPVLAEAASGARFGAGPSARIEAIEPLLASGLFEPDLILELGGTPTSAEFVRLCERSPFVERHIVHAHGFRAPYGRATSVTIDDPWAMARELAGRLGARSQAQPSAWRSAWLDQDRSASGLLAESLEPFHEGAAARRLVASLPSGALLCVGNSGPVRDLDFWCPPGGPLLAVIHQRGANGIDGLVAGAVGAARAARRPTALLVGDIATLHDLGSLSAAATLDTPLAIVIINNRGGRIFDGLPIGSAPGLESTLRSRFVVEHEFRFEHAVRQFGLAYRRVDNAAALGESLASALVAPGCAVIEADVPIDGAARRRAVMGRIGEQLRGRA